MIRLFLLLTTSLVLFARSGSCQSAEQPLDVFYLSVGSGDYAQASTADSLRGLRGFPHLRGADRSAFAVSDLLNSAGSRAGITLVSDPEGMVTRSDVLRQLDSLLFVVGKSKAPRPFIIYYFAGHGLSEGIAWNHFSIPGNVLFSGEASTLTVNDLKERAIYTGEIFDRLEASGYPFLLLLDNCQEGKNVHFRYPVLSATALENMEDVRAALRFMNEFQEPNVVMFSAEPGTPVREVVDPREDDPNTVLTVGPLGRRLLLTFSRTERDGPAFHLTDLVSSLSDPHLDAATHPAVTRSDPVPNNGPVTRSQLGRAEDHVVRYGSGQEGDVVPLNGRRESTPAAGIESLSAQVTGAVKLEIASPPGEYIGEGKEIALGPEGTRAVATWVDSGTIVLEIQSSSETWEMTFAAPNGQRIRQTNYSRAGRYGFQKPGQPGLSIIGGSRGCHDVDGEFRILTLQVSEGAGIVQLEATFVQSCDGGPSIRGKVRFTQ